MTVSPWASSSARWRCTQMALSWWFGAVSVNVVMKILARAQRSPERRPGQPRGTPRRPRQPSQSAGRISFAATQVHPGPNDEPARPERALAPGRREPDLHDPAVHRALAGGELRALHALPGVQAI